MSTKEDEPLRGHVTSYSPIDEVGTITLEDGRTLSFGRTACQGFTPAPFSEVFVTRLGPHSMGGLRAIEVTWEGTTAESEEYQALGGLAGSVSTPPEQKKSPEGALLKEDK